MKNTKGYLAALAVAVLFGALQFASGNVPSKSLQTNVPGYSGPVDTTYSSFGCKSPGSWSDTVWCNAYGSTYDSHVIEANKHASTIVMFKRNLPSYGDFYVVGNYGSTAVGKNGQTYYAGALVECPAGATVQYHSSSHHKYSPSLGEGFYDGNAHYWCDQNGVSVDPVVKSNVTGLDHSGTDKDKLFKFEFPDGTKKYKSYKDSTSTSSSGFVKCPDGSSVVGPYTTGNQYMNQYWVKEAGKRDYYRCYNSTKGTFEDATTDSVALASPYNSISVSYFKMDNVKNCDSTYTTCQPSAAAGDSAYGGADTVGPVTQACASNTYWCQTTDVNYRYCSADATCTAAEFTPPPPSYTLGNPTNVKLDPTYHPAGTTSIETDDPVYFTATKNITGLSIPTLPSLRFRVKVFSNGTVAPVWTAELSSATNSSTFGTLMPANTLSAGTYTFCMDVALNNDNSSVTNFDSANQKSSCVYAASSLTLIAPVVAPVSTCALSITLNDGTLTYNKGDYVNYTYSCSPAGTRAANTYVWLGKPDGTWTQYNSGTNIDTATLGFSTSNLDAGAYTLKVCLDSACTSGVVSTSFTIAASTTPTTPTTPGEPTLNGTIFKDGQYVDPATSTLRNCVSPNAWMKESSTASGARGFHCMPNYTATISDYPPTPCTGTLWAGGGTANFSSDYCATSKDSSVTPPQPPTPTSPKACAIGETCQNDGSWCNNGRQCYNTDGSFVCSNWNSACPAGTKRCSPNDTNCIEPGAYGPESGWCTDAMECFIDGKKFCQPWSYDSYGTSPSSTQCPAGSKKCSSNDPNCIEPGSAGPISGWCKDAMECYSTTGTQKYCQPWNNDPGNYKPASCPTEYPKVCNPTDTNCVEIGQKGPSTGWCAAGGKQCYLGDGSLFCAATDSSCPADSKVCRAGDTNCIEPGKYGPSSGWCGGSNSIQCYKNDGSQTYCAEVVGLSSDPQAWEKVSCPTDTSRCRKDDNYCLGSIGATGPSGSWCAVGMSKYNTDGSVTCVSGKDYMPPMPLVDPLVPKPVDPEVCVQVSMQAFDPSTSKCKIFASSCNVPAGWQPLTSSQICKDGKLSSLTDTLVDGGMLRFIEDELLYLDSFILQSKRLPEYVSGKEEFVRKVTDAQAKLKGLKPIADSSNETDRKAVKEILTFYTSSTKPDIEAKWAELSGYIESSDLKKEVEKELAEYQIELSRIDSTSEYAVKLSEGVEKLKGLLEALKTTQSGQARDQLTLSLKTVRKELRELVQSKRGDRTQDSFEAAVDGLKESLQRFRSIIEENNITDYKVVFMIDKFKALIEELDFVESDDYFVRGALLDQAMRMREKLATWLSGYGRGLDSGLALSVDQLLGHLDQKLADAIDKAFAKFENKLQVIMDEAIQKAAVTAVRLFEEAGDLIIDKASRVVSNLAHVNEQHREAIVESQNKIYEKLSDLGTALNTSTLGSFTADRLRAAMADIGTVTWCGDNTETVQSRINTIGLKLEVGELTSSEIDDLIAEVAELRAGNTEQCYLAGVTPGRDVPPEEWYYPPVQFNYERGMIRGYANPDGSLKGEIGVANPALRMEALKMAMILFGAQSGSYEEPSGLAGVPYWPNANGKNEANTYVNGALAAGIDLSYLQPLDKPITRIEAARLFVDVMRAIGADYFTPATSLEVINKYSDVATFSANREGALAVEALTDVGIFQGSVLDGSTARSFNPYEYLLRSEFATTNWRIVETYGVSGVEEVAIGTPDGD